MPTILEIPSKESPCACLIQLSGGGFKASRPKDMRAHPLCLSRACVCRRSGQGFGDAAGHDEARDLGISKQPQRCQSSGVYFVALANDSCVDDVDGWCKASRDSCGSHAVCALLSPRSAARGHRYRAGRMALRHAHAVCRRGANCPVDAARSRRRLPRAPHSTVDRRQGALALSQSVRGWPARWLFSLLQPAPNRERVIACTIWLLFNRARRTTQRTPPWSWARRDP